jgi:hypothetical protein
MRAIRRESVECEKNLPLILIKAFRVALGELIRGQGPADYRTLQEARFRRRTIRGFGNGGVGIYGGCP